MFASWMLRDGLAVEVQANKQSAGECFAVSAPGVLTMPIGAWSYALHLRDLPVCSHCRLGWSSTIAMIGVPIVALSFAVVPVSGVRVP